jgi:hypothetical protein
VSHTSSRRRALITKPQVLASSEPGETLLLYIVTTTQVVTATLVLKREEPEHVYKVQWLVYYISKVPSDYKTHYNQVQKLPHYNESRLVHVVTSYGLGEIVGNCLAVGRIAKWALELMGLDITYVPQTMIKSLALAYFMAKWTETQQPPKGECISMGPSLSTGSGKALCRSPPNEISSTM